VEANQAGLTFSARGPSALTRLERHGLAFAKRVKRRARRLMKEILVTALIGDESEPLLTHQTLDRSVHDRHVSS
jgi:hypothetical protein